MERVLGVAIGIATVCLLLSVIASHLQEVWAGYTARRAAQLEQGIAKMLGNPALTQAFFSHPLIENISFTPPRPFSRASSAPPARPTYVSSTVFSRVLYTALREVHQLPAQSLPDLINSLPDSSLKKRLKALILGIEGDGAACNLAIEQWYDGTMDRVNGLYKQKTQFFLLVTGLIMAIVCNANMFTVTERLWLSDDIRSAVTAAAQMYSCKDDPNCKQPDYNTAITTLEGRMKDYLPVGYNVSALRTYWSDAWGLIRHPDWSARHSDLIALFASWLFNCAGWLLMGIAVSLGAPFWFDVVNKLINIRMVGIKPPRADTEALSPSAATVNVGPQMNVPVVNVTENAPGDNPSDVGAGNAAPAT
jgi:hypothetical protein